MNKPAARAEQLRRELREYQHRYYVLHAPSISDAEYDRLFDELVALEAAHPQLATLASPTQRAGSDLAGDFAKIPHPAPILSLDKATTSEELAAWETRNRKLLAVESEDGALAVGNECELPPFAYTLEPKLDGLSIVCHYEDGLLTRAATRGNGLLGDDVSANVRTIPSVPLVIPVDATTGPPIPARLVVRGEVLFRKEDFARLNEEQEAQGLPRYINARNTASGALKQKDSRQTATRPLSAFFYAIVDEETDDDNIIPTTQWERLNFLRALGFPIAPAAAHFPSLDNVCAALTAWEEKRDSLPYEIDGLVINLDECALSRQLGVVGKNPRAAIAFKFPAQEVSTRLLGLTLGVGRSGKVTPAANLEPVFVGGVTVVNASLHNFAYIAARDIRLGDTVLLKRSGDVIPYVVGPLLGARTGEETIIAAPECCPFCDTPLSQPEGMVDLFCENETCPERVFRNVEYFVSRAAMDIAGFGPQTVRTLIAEGQLRDVGDIFRLQREALLPLERFATKKVDNLLAAIDSARERPPAQLLTRHCVGPQVAAWRNSPRWLGIDGVGPQVAALLLAEFSLAGCAGQCRGSGAGKRRGHRPDPGGQSGQAWRPRWFGDAANQQLLAKLREAGLAFVAESAPDDPTPRPLTGLSFVLTGTLPTISRKEASALISAAGGQVRSSVSAKTDYVVAGEAAGSKAAKAAALGRSDSG